MRSAAELVPPDVVARPDVEPHATTPQIHTSHWTHATRMTTYFGPRGWRLYDARFHWVQDTPVNRSSTDYLLNK